VRPDLRESRALLAPQRPGRKVSDNRQANPYAPGSEGLSQGDIERRTGLLRSYITRVEHGHTVPSLETLERLAAALDVPLYQLFYEGEEPPPLPDLPARQTTEDLALAEEGDTEKRFKRIRLLLAKKSRASGDANLVFGTLAKVFSKL